MSKILSLKLFEKLHKLNQLSYQKLDPNLSKAAPRLKYPVFGLELAIDPAIQATITQGWHCLTGWVGPGSTNF